jgi:hypothetical protein
MSGSEPRESLERRADSARVSGQTKQAIGLYEELIREDLGAGRMAKAISVYQKLIVWRPDDFDLHHRAAQMIARARESGAAPAGSGATASAQNAFFAGVPYEQVSGMLEKMEPSHFSPESLIVVEGEPGDSLFLIVEGTVAVRTRDEEGGEVELARLSAGDFFGEVSLLTSRPRTATVVAETPVEVLELSRDRVAELRGQFPDIDQALSEFHRLRAEKTVEALIERRGRA